MSIDIESYNYNNPNKTDECSICLEKISLVDDEILWQCQQCKKKFHKICINLVIIPECPMCRSRFIRENNTDLYDLTPHTEISITNDNNCMLYNELLKIIMYKTSLFIVIFFMVIIGLGGCLFLILPDLIHPERIYNFSFIK